MNLHEYQAKQLLSAYGIPTPPGQTIRQVSEISTALEKLPAPWVVKAQIHAGGRGKAGGVKVVHDSAALEAAVKALLGQSLVTPQSGGRALPVEILLIESAQPIAQELYLGLLVDRNREELTFIASRSGGMNIEEIAHTQPDKMIKEPVQFVAGLQPYQTRKVAFALGLQGEQIKQMGKIMTGLYKLFMEKDLSLIELNPLAILQSGELVALDGKINVEDNALYRQIELKTWRDMSQEEEKERIAQQYDLNYITLDGNIACMVNGAGLAMATMDLIQLHGGSPANFLDVGGGTTADKVASAFKLILSDSKVKAVLVNIFGGIVRCDLIAEGIIQALKDTTLNLPVVTRLAGTNVNEAKALLAQSGLNILSADDLTDAAQKVVAASRG